VVPTVLASAAKLFFTGRRKNITEEKIFPFFGQSNIIFLALALVIGPLIELPVLSVTARKLISSNR